MSQILSFPEDTALKYRYETRYRTATIMEEDALNQPTAAGEVSSTHEIQLSAPHMPTFRYLNEKTGTHFSLSLLSFFFRGRSLSAHAQ